MTQDWPAIERVAARADAPYLTPRAFQSSRGQATFPIWLQQPLRQVYRRLLENTLPHALLVHGPPGSGKRYFVETLSALLLCSSPQENSDGSALACGICASCSQLVSGNHTDFNVLKYSGSSRIISVDSARSFTSWLALTARAADARRVGVVDCIEDLNRSSANALLKTLEEPAAASVVLLVGNWPRSLPATLTSRCQLVSMGVKAEDAISWLGACGVANAEARLRQSHGAPFDVLTGQENGQQEQLSLLMRCFTEIVSRRAGITVWVERLKDEQAKQCLSQFLDFVSDILRVTQGAVINCLYSDEIERWRELASYLKEEQWFKLHRDLMQLAVADSASFKVQPVLETVFAAIWLEGVRSVALEPATGN